MNECMNEEINRWWDGDLIIPFHGLSLEYIGDGKCILQIFLHTEFLLLEELFWYWVGGICAFVRTLLVCGFKSTSTHSLKCKLSIANNHLKDKVHACSSFAPLSPFLWGLVQASVQTSSLFQYRVLYFPKMLQWYLPPHHIALCIATLSFSP